ncbi:cytochrome P450 [Elysia marginata]|uniref:Cytochrome P450 n=1 Tax=Elysia marginata TaxID=1093978 RepID=A0AAV4J176_9GAST|nr:cytochrome P450 [Elysia marginata]
MQSLLSSEDFPEVFSATSLLILTVTVLLVILYLHISVWNVERWEKYGVKHVDVGIMEVTHMGELALQGELDTVGSFRDTLALFTRDLDIVKTVTTKDFANFVDHPNLLATQSHLKEGLFFLRGDKWKRVRQLVSPSFR